MNHFCRTWSWSFYDFANTAFSAMYVTVFFPLLIKQFLGGSEFQVGLTFGLSMLLVGIAVPLLGALSDETGRRTPFIFILTLICIALTIVTGYLSLWPALVVGFLANATYHACLTIYNSFLPEVSYKGMQGTTSGYGISLGYFGTIGAIIAVYWLAEPFGLDTLAGIRAVFYTTAGFFLLFASPLFIAFWHERSRKLSVSLRSTLREVADTVRNLPKQKEIFYFLLGGFFYSNAITAVIIFLGLYAKTALMLPMSTFVFQIYPLLAIGAAVGAYLSGYGADRFGAKSVLIFAGVIWIIVLLGLMSYADSLRYFTVLSCLGGAAMGAVWTARRPLLIKLAPGKKIGEYFGFEELSNKFSGVVGPIIFGGLVTYWSYHAALWSLVIFFAVGIWCFIMMRKPR